MRILVVGKSGYVSTCFQSYIKKYPDVLVDSISARNEGWKEHDFHGYDAVFNATGLAHNDARKGTEVEFMALNAILPFELALKAKTESVPVFIHMSSMIVYGDMSNVGDFAFIDEHTKPKPENIYGISKLRGEENIQSLNDNNFHVAIIRSSLVYGESAVDNFLKLTDYAVKLPVFPNIQNYRSMIYSDNLCELIKLIAETKKSGLFYPQQEKHIQTAQLLYDIGDQAGHRVILTRVFNPLIKLLSPYIGLIRKVFGSEAYKLEASNHFEGAYRVVSYEESVKRIAASKHKNNGETL